MNINKEFYNLNILKNEKPEINNFLNNLQKNLENNYEFVDIDIVKKIPKNKNYNNIEKLKNSVICDLGGEMFCHNNKYHNVKFDINEIQNKLEKKLNFKTKYITGSGCGHGSSLNNHQGELYFLNNIKNKNNNSYSIRTNDNKTIIEKYNNTYYGGLGNLNFYYKNKKENNSHIIKINVRKRIGNKPTFTKIIQETLENENVICGLSGFINIKNGIIKSHIQPDYKDCPKDYFCCSTNKSVKGFLKFNNIDTKVNPLNCITTIWSRKFKNNFNFRESGEHTHFISENLKVGGHYHFDFDSTKDFIEYEAYLVFSDYLVKIRNPDIEKPKVCIVGAGAMGCLFGGLLKQNGLNVTLIDKWKEHIDNINNYGLVIHNKNTKINTNNENMKKFIKNKNKKILKIEAYTPENIPNNKYDIIIIQTKALQTREACQLIKNKNIYHKDTSFISFQNGLGNEDIISEEFNHSNNVFGGQTLQGANIVSPGIINIHTNLPSYIGEWNDKNEKTEMVTDILNRYGVPCEYDPEIKKRLWMKFIYNCVVSPLSALTNLCHKDIYNKDNSLYIANLIINECLIIANKEKINITKEEAKECLNKVIQSKQNNKSSMCYDINNNKHSEIDFINGKIVELSKKYNINLPINTSLYFLIKCKESTF